MSEKRNVILWTCLAAGLFCMELILVSLTPLAKIGNGTRFGSSGMFYNLYMGGGSYLIPLALYCMNVRAMKYVIGCVNGLWLICHPDRLAVGTVDGKKVAVEIKSSSAFDSRWGDEGSDEIPMDYLCQSQGYFIHWQLSGISSAQAGNQTVE